MSATRLELSTEAFCAECPRTRLEDGSCLLKEGKDGNPPVTVSVRDRNARAMQGFCKDAAGVEILGQDGNPRHLNWGEVITS